jgi:hypothetical protein
MFGSERNGLLNEDLVYATRLLQIPTNPAFSSLNLGQAVQICGYVSGGVVGQYGSFLFVGGKWGIGEKKEANIIVSVRTAVSLPSSLPLFAP